LKLSLFVEGDVEKRQQVYYVHTTTDAPTATTTIATTQAKDYSEEFKEYLGGC